MEKIILKRMKQVAKLERLIEDDAPYELVLQQSKIIDKCIALELKKRLELK